MAGASPKPLTIWAVSDGRAGIANQVLGLAEAIARLVPATVTPKTLRYQQLFDRWPTALKLFPDAMLATGSDSIVAPWPDLWIAAGRATLPHSLKMKGKTFVVQLQDPRHNVRAFDLVIAPEHDRVAGDNVLSLIGSTNRITPERLAEAYVGWQSRIDALPHPRVAVLIGGRSKAYDLDAAHAEIVAAEVRSAVETSGGSALVTVSRRTPEDARQVLATAFVDLPGVFHDGAGDNPYFAFLHAADHFLVTEDSVNMATEAATTGKPLQILSLTRRSLGSGEKFEDFHETLRARGVSHPFNGHLAGEAYPPLNETDKAAHFVLDRYTKKAAKA